MKIIYFALSHGCFINDYAISLVYDENYDDHIAFYNECNECGWIVPTVNPWSK
jgi:hypothetical protein